MLLRQYADIKKCDLPGLNYILYSDAVNSLLRSLHEVICFQIVVADKRKQIEYSNGLYLKTV